MSRGGWRHRRSRRAGAGASATRTRSILPTPELDPYFTRTAGADQVAPPVVAVETTAIAFEDEPDIVRDYRIRNQMITLERTFQLTGKQGSYHAVLAIGIICVNAGTNGEIVGGPTFGNTGALFNWLQAHVPWVILLWQNAPWLVLVATFGWASRGLARAHRSARIVLSMEAIAAAANASAMLKTQSTYSYQYAVLLSAAFVLALLWRPRGRLYFSDAYQALVERTPAIIVPRETGRFLATLLYASILVIQFALCGWTYRLLNPV